MIETYTNKDGKVRKAYSPEISKIESNKRRTYFKEELSDRIIDGFENKEVKVKVSLVGSAACDKAGPESDIDCLIDPAVPINDSRSDSWKFLLTARSVWLELQETAEYNFDFHLDIGEYSIRI